MPESGAPDAPCYPIIFTNVIDQRHESPPLRRSHSSCLGAGGAADIRHTVRADKIGGIVESQATAALCQEAVGGPGEARKDDRKQTESATPPDPLCELPLAEPPLNETSSGTVQPCEIFRFATSSGNNALNTLYEVQEEAARRIAHRLHDESAQLLATVYLELAEIACDCAGATAGKVARVVAHLDEVCEQLRGLSHELRPLILDQLGLMPALRLLVGGVKKRSGLELVVSGCAPEALPKTTETALYRVVQEALSNVVRHAGATRVEIRLWIENDRICCVVSDNGIGFNASDYRLAGSTGLGLIGIHERVAALHGDCKIVSRRGQGMELQVEVPL